MIKTYLLRQAPGRILWDKQGYIEYFFEYSLYEKKGDVPLAEMG